MRLPPLPTARELLDLYRIRALKQLGQNFILDMNVARKIVWKCGNMKDNYVCEIGPGPGPLTRAILESDVRHLYVVEKDRRFLPSLQLLADCCSDRMSIFVGDVLDFDMTHLLPDEAINPWDSDKSPNIHIIGNLPFNISTALVIRWLKAMSQRAGIFRYGRVPLTLTFQLEVAQRMLAPPNDEHRCRLSVMCQHLADVRLKYTIPSGCFVPEPKVDAALVSFRPLKKPVIEHEFELVEKVCRTIFHHRQKSFMYGIRCLFPPQLADSADRLSANMSINAAFTPFMLTNDHFGRICDIYANILKRFPALVKYDFVQQKKTAPLFDSFAQNDSFVADLNRIIDEVPFQFRGIAT